MNVRDSQGVIGYGTFERRNSQRAKATVTNGRVTHRPENTKPNYLSQRTSEVGIITKVSVTTKETARKRVRMTKRQRDRKRER